MGWQEYWRQGVSDTLALRRRSDILALFNASRPHEVPVNILPISHLFILDQSPQSVDPVHTTTLAPKGAGECGVSTAGKKKERITTRFCCGFDGRKFPALIVFKAT
jgi:hypothetical protein